MDEGEENLDHAVVIVQEEAPTPPEMTPSEITSRQLQHLANVTTGYGLPNIIWFMNALLLEETVAYTDWISNHDDQTWHMRTRDGNERKLRHPHDILTELVFISQKDTNSAFAARFCDPRYTSLAALNFSTVDFPNHQSLAHATAVMEMNMGHDKKDKDAKDVCLRMLANSGLGIGAKVDVGWLRDVPREKKTDVMCHPEIHASSKAIAHTVHAIQIPPLITHRASESLSIGYSEIVPILTGKRKEPLNDIVVTHFYRRAWMPLLYPGTVLEPRTVRPVLLPGEEKDVMMANAPILSPKERAPSQPLLRMKGLGASQYVVVPPSDQRPWAHTYAEPQIAGTCMIQSWIHIVRYAYHAFGSVHKRSVDWANWYGLHVLRHLPEFFGYILANIRKPMNEEWKTALTLVWRKMQYVLNKHYPALGWQARLNQTHRKLIQVLRDWSMSGSIDWSKTTPTLFQVVLDQQMRFDTEERKVLHESIILFRFELSTPKQVLLFGDYLRTWVIHHLQDSKVGNDMFLLMHACVLRQWACLFVERYVHAISLLVDKATDQDAPLIMENVQHLFQTFKKWAVPLSVMDEDNQTNLQSLPMGQAWCEFAVGRFHVRIRSLFAILLFVHVYRLWWRLSEPFLTETDKKSLLRPDAPLPWNSITHICCDEPMDYNVSASTSNKMAAQAMRRINYLLIPAFEPRSTTPRIFHVKQSLFGNLYLDKGLFVETKHQAPVFADKGPFVQTFPPSPSKTHLTLYRLLCTDERLSSRVSSEQTYSGPTEAQFLTKKLHNVPLHVDGYYSSTLAAPCELFDQHGILSFCIGAANAWTQISSVVLTGIHSPWCFVDVFSRPRVDSDVVRRGVCTYDADGDPVTLIGIAVPSRVVKDPPVPVVKARFTRQSWLLDMSQELTSGSDSALQSLLVKAASEDSGLFGMTHLGGFSLFQQLAARAERGETDAIYPEHRGYSFEDVHGPSLLLTRQNQEVLQSAKHEESLRVCAQLLRTGEPLKVEHLLLTAMLLLRIARLPLSTDGTRNERRKAHLRLFVTAWVRRLHLTKNKEKMMRFTLRAEPIERPVLAEECAWSHIHAFYALMQLCLIGTKEESAARTLSLWTNWFANMRYRTSQPEHAVWVTIGWFIWQNVLVSFVPFERNNTFRNLGIKGTQSMFEIMLMKQQQLDNEMTLHIANKGPWMSWSSEHVYFVAMPTTHPQWHALQSFLRPCQQTSPGARLWMPVVVESERLLGTQLPAMAKNLFLIADVAENKVGGVKGQTSSFAVQQLEWIVSAPQLNHELVWTKLKTDRADTHDVRQHLVSRMMELGIPHRVHSDAATGITFVDIWHYNKTGDMSLVAQVVFRRGHGPLCELLYTFDPETGRKTQQYSLLPFSQYVRVEEEQCSLFAEEWCKSLPTLLVLPLYKDTDNGEPCLLVINHTHPQLCFRPLQAEVFHRGWLQPRAELTRNLRDPCDWFLDTKNPEAKNDVPLYPCCILPLSAQSMGMFPKSKAINNDLTNTAFHALLWCFVHALASHNSRMVYRLAGTVSSLLRSSQLEYSTNIRIAIRELFNYCSLPLRFRILENTNYMFEAATTNVIERQALTKLTSTPEFFASLWTSQKRLITLTRPTFADPDRIAIQFMSTHAFGQMMQLAHDDVLLPIIVYHAWNNLLTSSSVDERYKRGWYLAPPPAPAGSEPIPVTPPPTASCRIEDVLFEVYSGMLLQSEQKKLVDQLEAHLWSRYVTLSEEDKDKPQNLTEWLQTITPFMGSGKSDVLIPLLTLRLLTGFCITKQQGTILIVVPPHLVKSTFRRLLNLLSIILPTVECILFDPSTYKWNDLSRRINLRVGIINDASLKHMFAQNRAAGSGKTFALPVTNTFVLMDEVDMMYNPVSSEFNLVHQTNQRGTHPITQDRDIGLLITNPQTLWYERFVCGLAFDHYPTLVTASWPADPVLGVALVQQTLDKLLLTEKTTIAALKDTQPTYWKWKAFLLKMHNVARIASTVLIVNYRCGLNDDAASTEFLAQPMINGVIDKRSKFSDPDICAFVTCLCYAHLVAASNVFPRPIDLARIETQTLYTDIPSWYNVLKPARPDELSSCTLVSLAAENKTDSSIMLFARQSPFLMAQWYVVWMVLEPFMMYPMMQDSVPFSFFMQTSFFPKSTLGMSGTATQIPLVKENVKTDSQKVIETKIKDLVQHASIVCTLDVPAEASLNERLAANVTQLLDQLTRAPYSVLIDCGAVLRDKTLTQAVALLAKTIGNGKIFYIHPDTETLMMYEFGKVDFPATLDVHTKAALSMETQAKPGERYLLYYDYGHTVGTDVPFLPTEKMHILCTVNAGMTRLTELAQATYRVRALAHLQEAKEMKEKKLFLDYFVTGMALFVQADMNLRRSHFYASVLDAEERMRKTMLALHDRQQARYTTCVSRAWKEGCLEAPLSYRVLDAKDAKSLLVDIDLSCSISQQEQASTDVAKGTMMNQTIANVLTKLNIEPFAYVTHMLPWQHVRFALDTSVPWKDKTLPSLISQFAQLSPGVCWLYEQAKLEQKKNQTSAENTFTFEPLYMYPRSKEQFTRTNPAFYLRIPQHGQFVQIMTAAEFAVLQVAERKLGSQRQTSRWCRMCDFLDDEPWQATFARFLFRLPIPVRRQKALLDRIALADLTIRQKLQACLDVTTSLFEQDGSKGTQVQTEIQFALFGKESGVTGTTTTKRKAEE